MWWFTKPKVNVPSEQVIQASVKKAHGLRKPEYFTKCDCYMCQVTANFLRVCGENEYRPRPYDLMCEQYLKKIGDINNLEECVNCIFENGKS